MDPNAFNQMMFGWDTHYSGGVPPAMRVPFFGAVPPDSPYGALFQSLAPMIGEQLRAATGSFAMTFGSNNAFDAWQAQQYNIGLVRGQQQMAGLDRARLADLTRGLAIAGGHQFTVDPTTGLRTLSAPGAEDALMRMSGVGQQMLPILASFAPDAVDRALAGSRTVAFRPIFTAARLMPGGADAQGLTQSVMDNLFGTNPNQVDLNRTGGLLAGAAGGAFEELARRGVIGGGMGGDVGALGGKVSEQLRGYLGAIQVMKDIFGDNGNPDAPMRQIITGLQGLTQGGLGVLDPNRMKQLALEYRTVATTTFLGQEGAQAALARGGQLAQAFGVDPRYMVGGPMLEAASRNAFHRLNFQASFEGMGVEQLAAFQQQLRASGASSFAGNMTGAALALGETVGADTPLGRLRAELAAGRGGQGLSVAALEDLAVRSGVAPGTVTAQLANRRQNQAFLAANPGAGGSIEAMQGVDLRGMLGFAIAGTGMGSRQGEIADLIMGQAGEARSTMDLADRVADKMGLSGPDRARFASSLGTGIGMMGEVLPPGVGMLDVIRSQTPAALKARAEEEDRIRMRSRVNGILSQMGRAGVVGNLSQSLIGLNRDVSGNADMSRMFLDALGAIPSERVREAIKDEVMRAGEVDQMAGGLGGGGIGLAAREGDIRRRLEKILQLDAANQGGLLRGQGDYAPLSDDPVLSAVGAMAMGPALTQRAAKTGQAVQKVSLQDGTTLNVTITDKTVNPSTGSVKATGTGVVVPPANITVPGWN